MHLPRTRPRPAAGWYSVAAVRATRCRGWPVAGVGQAERYAETRSRDQIGERRPLTPRRAARRRGSRRTEYSKTVPGGCAEGCSSSAATRAGRVGPVGPERQQRGQARGMGHQPAQRHRLRSPSANAGQPGGERLVQREDTLVDQGQQGGGDEEFRDRGEIEDRVAATGWTSPAAACRRSSAYRARWPVVANCSIDRRAGRARPQRCTTVWVPPVTPLTRSSSSSFTLGTVTGRARSATRLKICVNS